MSIELTPAQRLATECRGSAILVSAAAGSGKTRVLTQRLVDYVTDPAAPEDIDRFLVITYTRAAAAELRSRIMDALTAQAAKNPADTRLRRQQSLCCRAPIGTIHSFCTGILREYSHLLGISPAFTVLEEDRAEQLKTSVLSRQLDKSYESIEDEPDFRLLSDTVGAGRDDRALQDAVLNLYDKLRSHPFPEDWAAEQEAALAAEGVDDVGSTVWGGELLREAAVSADYWIGAMEEALEEIRAADEKLRRAFEASYADTVAALRTFRSALNRGWDAAMRAADVAFPRAVSPKKYPDSALLERLKAVRNGCKDACGKLRDTFSQDSAALLRELRAAAPAMRALLKLTLSFDRAFAAEKTRRGVLDFSDLERYAVRLLVDRSTGAPTWVALELSQRYTEIMVDEYQDVNAVQELIFRAVSRNGANLFLVGDVKQSIYRFRLADPGMFLEKYRTYAPADTAAPGQPRRILLQENFRSRRPILTAVNRVMGSIMSEALGELDYDEDAALKYGARDYDPALDVPAELHIIDAEGGDENDEAPEAAELEARFVADQILSLMRSGAPVTENGVTRPCRWSDFVLLMRSPGGKGKVFHSVLEARGIPVESRQGERFFSGLEVAVIVDLLAVIGNPHSDIPLISALRSPAFGFSADELSAIRAADRSSDFYTALCRAAEGGSARCAAFLRQLEDWRALAQEISPEQLVWRLCSDTQMFAVCSAMNDGQQRRRNLMHLFELARSFGESGYKGLFHFVRWLRRMAESGSVPEPTASGDAVRILSVHRSKGLEFPFVFLCDLAHRFNTRDFRERVLMHSSLGLGPRVVDTERGVQYPTVAWRAVRQRLTAEMLSEEMRVLYVGMTRAKERLYLSWVWTNPQKKLDALLPQLRAPLPPELLRGATDFSKWLALAALLHPDALPITLHGTEERTGADAAAQAAAAPERGAVEKAYAYLRERLEYVYPWAGAADLPSKLTATELKDPRAEQDPDAAPVLADPAAETLSFRRAQPGTARKLSAARRGTATHTLLQHVDFRSCGSVGALREEAARLVSTGLLQQEEAAAVDYGAVQRFFASPVGQRLRAAEGVRREFRFQLLADASDYFPGAAPEDQLLLQGVVDCCFPEDGGITVLDYKTDRIGAEQVPERAADYLGQLRTYALALERIFGLPVKHCILWFLHPGTEYEVALEKA